MSKFQKFVEIPGMGLQALVAPAVERNGRLEVICGPMFSGKTEELIRRLTRSQIAGKTVLCYKHVVDSRSGGWEIQTHSGGKFQATTVSSLATIEMGIDSSIDVIGIDEIQFFDDENAFDIVLGFVEMGLTVIVAGLDMTYRREPFEPVPKLLAVADEIIKLNSVCHSCGADAIFTQRLIDDKPAPFKGETVVVGGLDTYEARCRSCFEIA